MKTLRKVLKQLKADGLSFTGLQALEELQETVYLFGITAANSHGVACEAAVIELQAIRDELDRLIAAFIAVLVRGERRAAKRKAYEAAQMLWPQRDVLAAA